MLYVTTPSIGTRVGLLVPIAICITIINDCRNYSTVILESSPSLSMTFFAWNKTKINLEI